jgi:hypothetical protein
MVWSIHPPHRAGSTNQPGLGSSGQLHGRPAETLQRANAISPSRPSDTMELDGTPPAPEADPFGRQQTHSRRPHCADNGRGLVKRAESGLIVRICLPACAAAMQRPGTRSVRVKIATASIDLSSSSAAGSATTRSTPESDATFCARAS